MKNKVSLPMDILCRELTRLDNDIDRLQMLVTLKSHLQNLQLTPNILQIFFSIFNDEKYRLQAIHQLLPSIYTSITSDSLKKLLELFHHHQNRLNLIETLKNCELLKSNHEVNEILLNEYRQYFHVKKPIKISENPESDLSIITTSNVVKTLSNTSGVFEKAKQFVCRVFGGGSSPPLDQELPSKRLIDEVNSSTDNLERKKFHSLENDCQFQPTSMPLSISQSYTSLITKSPPPSSPITRQSSMSFHIDESSFPMVTQIHSILDNIDSVLDKIEAQANSVIRQPIFNENHSPTIETQTIQQNIDQITQTTINFVEHHLNLNDGSGDTTSGFLDLIDLIEESNSIMSSDVSEEVDEI